ncbi:S-adenosyl-L-methionine-dependent methyltransferase, partial [Aspergillus ellipticus CBS 707.79]
GSQLSDCISSRKDPLCLLFHDPQGRELVDDIYARSPLFMAGILYVSRTITEIIRKFGASRPIRILQLGGGSGGPTNCLFDQLSNSANFPFEYTFSDKSSSMVSQAQSRFQGCFMRFAQLDIEKEPRSLMQGQYDIVISLNYLHRTWNLIDSSTNSRALLRPTGVLCVWEITRPLGWLDIVFGLLDEWWNFDDGRGHILTSEAIWFEMLRDGGFTWVG